jgi:lysophospholipid acyltransferase (LPLAT)-like uncharacterized protein
VLNPILERAAITTVSALASTWRFEVQGEHHVRRLRETRTPIVFTVWHANLLPPLWHRRNEGITLLVSEHGDATFLANSAARLGYNVVRGSSTRGAIKGTKGILRVLRSGGDVALTPDGPTGPARVAKPGASAIAARTGAAILPIGAGASSWWQIRSWDRFSIPRPFSCVHLIYGEPLILANMSEHEEIESLALLSARLDDATEAASC